MMMLSAFPPSLVSGFSTRNFSLVKLQVPFTYIKDKAVPDKAAVISRANSTKAGIPAYSLVTESAHVFHAKR